MTKAKETALTQAIETSRKEIAALLRGTAQSMTESDYKSAARKIEIMAEALNVLIHLESQLG